MCQCATDAEPADTDEHPSDRPQVIGRTPDPDNTPTPATVLALAGGRPLRPGWLNEAGGLTFEVGAGTERCFIKWKPPADAGFHDEATRLRWAHQFASVPAVLDEGHNATGAWLVTAALPGTSAVAPLWLNQPATAATAIGRGLRALHDPLPTQSCPFSWSTCSPDRWSSARHGAASSTPAGRLAGPSRHWVLVAAMVLLWLCWGTSFPAMRIMVATLPPLAASGAIFPVAGLVLAATCPRTVLGLDRREIATAAGPGMCLLVPRD